MQGFSDLMGMLQMQVRVYHNAKVCGQWQINEHELGATCFHVVTEGNCSLQVPGQLRCQLHTGDLLIFPRELPHSMGAIQPSDEPQVHLNYQANSALSGTGMLCGKVSFAHPAAQQILDALPPVLIIQREQSAPWLDPLLSLILTASYQQHSAGTVVLDRLSELLFIYALQHHFSWEKQHPQSSFMALYNHPRLVKALAAMHANPQKNWSLAELATTANQSRTTFSNSFRSVSGWTVMQYLSWWRMQLAWSLLLQGKTVANVAEQVGYQSEAAFSRVFTKHFKLSAGEVRRAPQKFRQPPLAKSVWMPDSRK
ncbi:MAG: AraC family transcriptional regulator [Pseudomonadales bacterium]|nr:AraC family transcriptional regulator [Pseudomonadales bacterium]